MLQKLQLYALIGLMAFSVLAGGATYVLWNQNAKLEDRLEIVTIARNKAKENLALVSAQLAEEREIREATEAALANLREVPDVEYNTPLPDSIRSVLDDFNTGLQ